MSKIIKLVCIGVLAGLLLASVLPFGITPWSPEIAYASDEVTVYLSEYARITGEFWEWGQSFYEYPTTQVSDHEGAANRLVWKVPKQSNVAGIEKVELKVVYDEWLETFCAVAPGGQRLYVYRITRSDTDITNLTWQRYKSEHFWSTLGGDFTTSGADYYQFTGVESTPIWLTFDITSMATTAWDAGNDLFMLMKFQYEEIECFEVVRVMVYGGHSSAGAYRAKIIVTYEEAPPPEITASLTSKKDTTAVVGLNVKLHGEASGNVSIQWDAYGSSTWGNESATLVVTDDGDYSRAMSGLVEDTRYEVRGVLKYGAETLYSDVFDFTTLDFIPPDMTATFDDKGVYWFEGMVVYDAEGMGSGYVAIQWRQVGWVNWRTGTESFVTGAGNITEVFEDDWDAGRDVMGDIEIRGRFRGIEGTFYSDVVEESLLTAPSVVWTVEDVSWTTITFRATYELNDADEIDLQVQMREQGYFYFTLLSDKVTKSENGSHDLVVAIGDEAIYEYRGAVWCPNESASGSVKYSETAEVIGSGLVVWPTVTTEWPYNVETWKLQLRATVALNDAAGVHDCLLYFVLKDKITGVEVRSPGQVVTSDGLISEYVWHGELVEINRQYDVEARLAVGKLKTVVGGWKELHTAGWADGIASLEVVKTGATVVEVGYRLYVNTTFDHAKLAVWVWDIDKGVYTEANTSITQLGTGYYTYRITGLEANTNYWVRIRMVYPVPSEGQRISFTSGSGSAWEPGFGWGGIPWPDLPWDTLRVIAGLFLTVAAGGVIMWKLRQRSGQVVAMVAMVGCVLVFALLGWFPVWIVLLVSMVLVLGIIFVLKSGGASQEA